MPGGHGMLHALASSKNVGAGRRTSGPQHSRDGFHGYHDGGPRKWNAETSGGRSFARVELAGLCAEPWVLRAGTTAFRSSSVCSVDRTGDRGGSGLGRGNDSARAALDPGESGSSPAGRSNGGASKEFSILLCVAG